MNLFEDNSPLKKKLKRSYAVSVPLIEAKAGATRAARKKSARRTPKNNPEQFRHLRCNFLA